MSIGGMGGLFWRSLTAGLFWLNRSFDAPARRAHKRLRPQPLVNHPASFCFDFSFSLLDGCSGSILPNRRVISCSC